MGILDGILGATSAPCGASTGGSGAGDISNLAGMLSSIPRLGGGPENEMIGALLDMLKGGGGNSGGSGGGCNF